MGRMLVRKSWVLLCAALWGADCAKKARHAQPCIEGLMTAENHAHCLSNRYTELAANAKDFKKRQTLARQLLDDGDSHFNSGQYRKAELAYSNSVVWLPSSKAMVKMGDAVFYRQMLGTETGGEERKEQRCSTYFVQAVELHLTQTYDAALKFHEFEELELGIRVPAEEVERVRRKATCLESLAQEYRNVPNACVDGGLIKQCLE